MTEPRGPEPVDPPETAPQCPWCAAPVAEDATNCRECGAAVAQRESIGGLKIAGLTSVDPALEDFDKRPLHLRGPSPTQGLAPAMIIGAAAGGPIGLLAIGGVAAVAATEFLGSTRDGIRGPALGDVGKPSEVLLQALERARDGDDGDAEDPERAAPNGTDATAPHEPDAAVPQEPDAAAADGGRSIWRDLPSPDGEGSV
jgi:hypothetical protein